MLKRLLSIHGKPHRYAGVLATGLAAYLTLGFVAAKWIFIGEVQLPSFLHSMLIIGGTALFALIHISSMRKLDSVKRKD